MSAFDKLSPSGARVSKLVFYAQSTGSGARRLTDNKITITIYFINPSGKLKLSFDRTTKTISE